MKLIDISGEVRGETDKALRLYDGTRTEWEAAEEIVSPCDSI